MHCVDVTDEHWTRTSCNRSPQRLDYDTERRLAERVEEKREQRLVGKDEVRCVALNNFPLDSANGEVSPRDRGKLGAQLDADTPAESSLRRKHERLPLAAAKVDEDERGRRYGQVRNESREAIRLDGAIPDRVVTRGVLPWPGAPRIRTAALVESSLLPRQNSRPYWPRCMPRGKASRNE